MDNKLLIQKLLGITTVITDVDGVLTDGGMYYTETGDELKKFNVRDGAGVALLKAAGLKAGAMSGEKLELIDRRLQKINLDFSFTGIKNKLTCLEQYLAENRLDAKQVAYIGDEINDYCLLEKVGVFFAVADANPVIKDKADYTLKVSGGQGVLGEAAHIILSAQNKFDKALKTYLDSIAK
jgi:YrbI family 3-deoxy-D-manno-octulosonate 8-phosphate phosphatase